MWTGRKLPEETLIFLPKTSNIAVDYRVGGKDQWAHLHYPITEKSDHRNYQICTRTSEMRSPNIPGLHVSVQLLDFFCSTHRLMKDSNFQSFLKTSRLLMGLLGRTLGVLIRLFIITLLFFSFLSHHLILSYPILSSKGSRREHTEHPADMFKHLYPLQGHTLKGASQSQHARRQCQS